MHFMHIPVKRFYVHDPGDSETTDIMPAESNRPQERLTVGRRKKSPPEQFGERLRALRKAAGFTQIELANVVGTSQRMIAYYEAQGGNVSADIAAKLAEVLNVSLDDLLNTEQSQIPAAKKQPHDLRLMRKLRQVEKLPIKERRSVLQFIDALVERQALKKAQA